MTAQKKAIEFINKFFEPIKAVAGNEYTLRILYSAAKQCALIAVEEILSLFINECEDTRFWREVKEEIEIL